MHPPYPKSRPFSLAWLILLLATPVLPAGTPAASPNAELYFKAPQYTGPAISPDGHSLGFIMQSNGTAGLFKMDRATGRLRPSSAAGEGEIARFWWTGNKRVLIAARGVRSIEYFVEDLSDAKPRPIHALDGWDPSLILTFPEDIDRHVIALKKRVDLARTVIPPRWKT